MEFFSYGVKDTCLKFDPKTMIVTLISHNYEEKFQLTYQDFVDQLRGEVFPEAKELRYLKKHAVVTLFPWELFLLQQEFKNQNPTLALLLSKDESAIPKLTEIYDDPNTSKRMHTLLKNHYRYCEILQGSCNFRLEILEDLNLVIEFKEKLFQQFFKKLENNEDIGYFNKYYLIIKNFSLSQKKKDYDPSDLFDRMLYFILRPRFSLDFKKRVMEELILFSKEANIEEKLFPLLGETEFLAVFKEVASFTITLNNSEIE